jgi:hypothetical protein
MVTLVAETGTNAMPIGWPAKDGQFQISDLASAPAQDATRHPLKSLALDAFGPVRLIEVQESGGNLVGMLIGIPVDVDAGTLPKTLVVDAPLLPNNVDNWVEEHIYRLAGGFLFLLDSAGHRRLYLDADGTRSAVYDPTARIAASTAMTLLGPEDYEARLQWDLFRRLDVAHAGWFPADLTAHVGIGRLLCNHYLDLDNWTVHRHWPLAPITPTSNPHAAMDAMLKRVGKTVSALHSAGDVTLALTAGTDSRYILSAVRTLAPELHFVTVAAPGAKLDVDSARVLAARCGLDHETLPYRQATEAQAQAWHIRTGHCVTGANRMMHPSVMPLLGRYFIGGLGGEIGRGFLWLDAQPNTPIDARNIIVRLKLSLEPEVLEAVERWLSPIAHFDTLLKLDLAYLELRMASWAFADAYANPIQTEMHPIISRANITAMLSMPLELRRQSSAMAQAIARAWPELLALPINRYGDWRDTAKRATDILANPRRAFRKLVQLVRLKRHRA